MLGQSLGCGVVKAIGNQVASCLLKVKQMGKDLITNSTKQGDNQAVSISDSGQFELVI